MTDMLATRLSAFDAAVEEDRPSSGKSVMVSIVFSDRCQLEVLRSVIQLVVVDVVDVVAASQGSSQDRFHDETMFVPPRGGADLDLPVDAGSGVVQATSSDGEGTGVLHPMVVTHSLAPAVRTVGRVAMPVSLEFSVPVVGFLQRSSAATSTDVLHITEFTHNVGVSKVGGGLSGNARQ